VNHVAVLLDGAIKKRDDIPRKTLERVRGYEKEVIRRNRGSRSERAVGKKTPVMDWIDSRLKADPRLAREVDEILGEMRLEQDLAALREKRKLTQRQVATLLGTSQPYVAKIESGRVKNLGIGTLVKYARALGGTVSIQIEPRSTAPRRARLKKAR
jgi:predicted XRE-type DNA-binding protein